MKKLAPFALAILASLVVAVTGMTQTLGAHPWWAQSVMWFGLPVGLSAAALAWFTGLRQGWRVIGAALLCGAAISVATLGKSRFAASYAEDAFAGHVWYLGWIAACAFFAACFASIAWPDRQSH